MKDEANESVSAGLSYSIEIKDAYIPPWIRSRMAVQWFSWWLEGQQGYVLLSVIFFLLYSEMLSLIYRCRHTC